MKKYLIATLLLLTLSLGAQVRDSLFIMHIPGSPETQIQAYTTDLAGNAYYPLQLDQTGLIIDYDATWPTAVIDQKFADSQYEVNRYIDAEIISLRQYVVNRDNNLMQEIILLQNKVNALEDKIRQLQAPSDPFDNVILYISPTATLQVDSIR